MTTLSLPWLAAGAALLVACTSAGAQQAVLQRTPVQPAAQAPSAPASAAQPQSGARSLTKRDAPGAAHPAGFNPRFSPDSERFVQRSGEHLYQAICQGCHMPQGQGAQGAGFYPALAQSARLAAGAYPVHVVLQGLHGMPPFGERLDDQQVADVVNYVRTHFGNSYQDTITAEAVKKQRP